MTSLETVIAVTATGTLVIIAHWLEKLVKIGERVARQLENQNSN